MFVPAFHFIIGDNGSHIASRTGQRADESAQRRRKAKLFEIAENGSQRRAERARFFGVGGNELILAFENAQHLRNGEQADHDSHHVKALHKRVRAKGKSGRGGGRVKAHCTDGQPDGPAEQTFHYLPRKHGTERGQAENTHPEKGFRAEFQRRQRERLKKEQQNKCAENAAEGRGQQGQIQGLFSFALARHGVAVKCRRHSCGLSGRVDEYGGVGAAVHGPAKDRSKPDEGCGCGHGEGERHKKRHGSHCGYAGQHAADDAHQQPHEQNEHIHGLTCFQYTGKQHAGDGDGLNIHYFPPCDAGAVARE